MSRSRFSRSLHHPFPLSNRLPCSLRKLQFPFNRPISGPEADSPSQSPAAGRTPPPPRPLSRSSRLPHRIMRRSPLTVPLTSFPSIKRRINHRKRLRFRTSRPLENQTILNLHIPANRLLPPSISPRSLCSIAL